MIKRAGFALFFACMGCGSLCAQNSPGTRVVAAPPNVPAPGPDENAAAVAKPIETIPLTVPKGTPMQVALEKEVKVKKIGQPIEGRVVEPVYAFDKVVVPAGTLAAGRITKIEEVSKGKRTLAALDADFTPSHKVQVEFDELILPDGKHIPVQTSVTPGSGQVIQFVTAPSDKKKGVKDATQEKIKQAKEQAKHEWNDAMKQVHKPGRMRRLERYAVAQLPFHPQYIDSGTVYFAELMQPLDFGSEPLTPDVAASLGSPPPAGSVVHARLLTALSSATTQKGAEVEALVSQPLFDGKKLIIPQGSRIKGSVVQVQPARRRKRNGQLRIVFHEFVPPDGVEQKVEASLEAVQAGKSDHLQLDSEGGAQVTSPKTRYLSTGVSLWLAAVASNGDGDADVTNRAAGGAGGYKLIGIGIGLAVHSQPLTMAMGTFGASRSVYFHFLARGRDVEFPKDTAMQVGFGAPIVPPQKSARKQ